MPYWGPRLIVSMFHQQVRFTTKNRVEFVKSSPKSLLGYMMKSRKHLNDECKTSEIGSILVTEELEIEKTPRWQVFELPAGTSKQEEFEEVIIHPNHPSQKVQIGKEMPLCLRNEII